MVRLGPRLHNSGDKRSALGLLSREALGQESLPCGQDLAPERLAWTLALTCMACPGLPWTETLAVGGGLVPAISSKALVVVRGGWALKGQPEGPVSHL